LKPQYLSFVSPKSLFPRDKKLTREEFVHKRTAVGGRGANGAKVGDGDGDGAAIEAEDDAAHGFRVGAKGEVR
jgi:hypothetical protein